MKSFEAQFSEIKELKQQKKFFQEKLLLNLLSNKNFDKNLYVEIQKFYLDLSSQIPFVNAQSIMEFVTQKILEEDHSDIEAKKRLGIFYINSEQSSQAIEEFEDLYLNYPDHLDISKSGFSIFKNGDTEKANHQFLTIINNHKFCYDAYYLLALHNKDPYLDEYLLKNIIDNLNEASQLDDFAFIKLKFHFRFNLKKEKNFEASFHHFNLACEKSREFYKNDIEKYLNNIEKLFTEKKEKHEYLSNQYSKHNKDDYLKIDFTPIFIVGVPRSGSTLIGV